jgi:hypothetical protein
LETSRTDAVVGAAVEPANCVARHTTTTHFVDGKLLATAFEPLDGAVSVNCLECFHLLPTRYERLQCVIRDLRTKPRKRTIRHANLFALLRVAHVNEIKPRVAANLIVRHDPENGDPSHCGIFGLEDDDVDKGERIALQQQLADIAESPVVPVLMLDPP